MATYCKILTQEEQPLFHQLNIPWFTTYAFRENLIKFFKEYSKDLKGPQDTNILSPIMTSIFNMINPEADGIPQLIDQAAPFIQFCRERNLPHAQVFDQLYLENASADDFNKNLETINPDHIVLTLELCLIIQSFNLKLKGSKTLTCQLLDNHEYAFSLGTEKGEVSLFKCFQALLRLNKVHMIHKLTPYIQPALLYGVAEKLYNMPGVAPDSVVYKQEAVKLFEHIVEELAKELLSDHTQNSSKRITCINGLYRLGNAYHYGKSVNANFEKAVRWCQQAAEQGDARMQLSLGYCYELGIGVPQDDTHAVHWYQQAANQGYAWAQFYLGLCYEHGECVPQSAEQAAYWLQEAANQVHADAQFNLGIYYEEGNGVTEDDAQAAYLFQKAANQGHAEAQNNLGFCYTYGEGVSQDPAQAVYWYQQAANQGYARAQKKLGTCYEHGQGVPQDDTQTVYWYQQAANQGYADGQFNLGRCYRNGKGVPQNDIQADHWYLQAAMQGDGEALEALKRRRLSISRRHEI